MSDAINHLINGDLEEFRQSINKSLYSKIGDAFSVRKQELAQELFSEEEECSECGENVQEENKEFAALAPPYDKITYADKIAGATKGKKGKKGKK